MLEMSESSTNLGRRQSKWEFQISISTLFVMLTACFTCRTVFFNKSQIFQHDVDFTTFHQICVVVEVFVYN